MLNAFKSLMNGVSSATATSASANNKQNKSNSAATAKARLSLVITHHDRIQTNGNFGNKADPNNQDNAMPPIHNDAHWKAMENEIIAVIQRYTQLMPDDINLQIEHTGTHNKIELRADVPVA